MKIEEFGPFVIFTALYAATTLGLPKIPLLAYQVKFGEMPTAFVAMFGYPAVLGLTLGQFIADVGYQASPIVTLSPVISFIGLIVIYRLRRISTLAGCVAYVFLTTAWLTYLLPITSGVSTSAAATSGFICQGIAVAIGYGAYIIATKIKPPTQLRMNGRQDTQ